MTRSCWYPGRINKKRERQVPGEWEQAPGSVTPTLFAHCLHCFSSKQSPATLARTGSRGLSFRSSHFRFYRDRKRLAKPEFTQTPSKWNKRS